MSGLNDFTTQNILRDESDKRNAQLADSSNYRKLKIRKEVIKLDSGYGPDYGSNPYLINYPFKGVFVKTASDGFVTATLAVDDDSSSSLQSGFDLSINDKFDLGRFASKGYIVAAPQPGKQMTLWFIVDGDFKSGSQLSLTAGGVSITRGSGSTTRNFPIAAAAVTQIFSTSGTRKLGTYVNESGGYQWYSSDPAVSKTGAKKGIPLAPGEKLFWENGGALYVYSDSAFSDAVAMEES
jgi:hypothetical protein